MKLEELRTSIDKIDRDLMELIEARMELAIRTSKFKKEIEDPKREQEVMGKLLELNLDLLKPAFREAIVRVLIGESKRLQKEHGKLIAFQGEHGAYGDVAARAFMPGGVFIPCLEFADVFAGVEEGAFDLGVVPVENSLEGAVTQPNELLLDTKLRVVGEAFLPIRHCLLAPHGSDYRQISVVYSHPQALAQCRGFLSRNKLQARPFYDTAGAAKMLAKERPFGAAAIASTLSAELYDLKIIKQGIEDAEANQTRFLLIAQTPFEGEGDKCSIVFVTKHEAGRLYAILQLFAEAGINLTRIASSPRRSDPGNYNFFCDFEGSDRDARIQGILKQVQEHAVHYNFLGCYPVAKREG